MNIDYFKRYIKARYDVNLMALEIAKEDLQYAAVHQDQEATNIANNEVKEIVALLTFIDRLYKRFPELKLEG